MALEFYPGEEVQRDANKGLYVKFQDDCGVPTNVYKVTYSLYYVDPGPPEQEVATGCLNRVPVNPQVGEYYAAFHIPPSAQVGKYRIRWEIIQSNGGAASEVVMEFNVVAQGGQTVQYSNCVKKLVRRLRIHLRDHCIGEEEVLLLDVDGELMQVTIKQLWEAIHE